MSKTFRTSKSEPETLSDIELRISGLRGDASRRNPHENLGPRPLTTHRSAGFHRHSLPSPASNRRRPQDWEASLALARMAVAQGIRTVVATPHQLGNYERNTAEQILLLAVGLSDEPMKPACP